MPGVTVGVGVGVRVAVGVGVKPVTVGVGVGVSVGHTHAQSVAPPEISHVQPAEHVPYAAQKAKLTIAPQGSGVRVTVGVGVGVSPVTVGVGVFVGVGVAVGVAVNVGVGVGVSPAFRHCIAHSCCPGSVVPPVSVNLTRIHFPASAPLTAMSWQLQFLSVLVNEQHAVVEVVPVIELQLSVDPMEFWDHSADADHVPAPGDVLTIAIIEQVPKL